LCLCAFAPWREISSWIALPLLPFLFSCLFLCGCWRPPDFRPNTEGRDPAGIAPERAAAIRDALTELFGTPKVPKVPAGAGLRSEWLAAAAGAVASDDAGNQRGLFRRHCAACHGISGDGAGPSAAVLVPYPRDFRDGVFKYTSTTGGAKPARRDLRRTLRSGIAGTAMPSFRTLADGDLDALAEYVRYLSIRGQTELYLAAEVLDEDEPLPLDFTVVRAEGAQPAADSWRKAEDLLLDPPPPCDAPGELAARIARGRALFTRRDSRCVECHGPQGRGDGPRWGELYDDWNKRKLGLLTGATAGLPSSAGNTVGQAGHRAEHGPATRFRLPLQGLRPRNFTEGIFRGGDRPKDLYWRIAVGIKGTPMPAFGPSPASPGVLAPAEIWDVVQYVRSLSGGHGR
jgi:mono/diheme cytochrome c family protein